MALQLQPNSLMELLKPLSQGLPGITGGIGGGTFNMDGPQATPGLQQPMPPLAPDSGEPKKPGLFGKGGTGWSILGVLGDALRAANGQEMVFAPSIVDMRKRADEERKYLQRLQQQAEQAKQERAAANAEWDRRNSVQQGQQQGYYDYQREHPKPVLVPDGMGGARWITPPAMGGQDQPQDVPDMLPPDFFEQGGAGPGQPGFRP